MAQSAPLSAGAAIGAGATGAENVKPFDSAEWEKRHRLERENKEKNDDQIRAQWENQRRHDLERWENHRREVDVSINKLNAENKKIDDLNKKIEDLKKEIKDRPTVCDGASINNKGGTSTSLCSSSSILNNKTGSVAEEALKEIIRELRDSRIPVKLSNCSRPNSTDIRKPSLDYFERSQNNFKLDPSLNHQNENFSFKRPNWMNAYSPVSHTQTTTIIMTQTSNSISTTTLVSSHILSTTLTQSIIVTPTVFITFTTINSHPTIQNNANVENTFSHNTANINSSVLESATSSSITFSSQSVTTQSSTAISRKNSQEVNINESKNATLVSNQPVPLGQSIPNSKNLASVQSTPTINEINNTPNPTALNGLQASGTNSIAQTVINQCSTKVTSFTNNMTGNNPNASNMILARGSINSYPKCHNIEYGDTQLPRSRGNLAEVLPENQNLVASDETDYSIPASAVMLPTKNTDYLGLMEKSVQSSPIRTDDGDECPNDLKHIFNE